MRLGANRARRLDDVLVRDGNAVRRARVADHPSALPTEALAPAHTRAKASGARVLPAVMLPNKNAELGVADWAIRHLAVGLPSGQDDLHRTGPLYIPNLGRGKLMVGTRRCRKRPSFKSGGCRRQDRIQELTDRHGPVSRRTERREALDEAFLAAALCLGTRTSLSRFLNWRVAQNNRVLPSSRGGWAVPITSPGIIIAQL